MEVIRITHPQLLEKLNERMIDDFRSLFFDCCMEKKDLVTHFGMKFSALCDAAAPELRSPAIASQAKVCLQIFIGMAIKDLTPTEVEKFFVQKIREVQARAIQENNRLWEKYKSFAEDYARSLGIPLDQVSMDLQLHQKMTAEKIQEICDEKPGSIAIDLSTDEILARSIHRKDH